MKKNKYHKKFLNRHIALNEIEKTKMLNIIGYKSLDDLINDTVPASIRSKKGLNLPASKLESEFIEEFNNIASKNEVFKNYIGQGFHPSYMPAVIQRNVFENPGWYTSYTPYQAEISQGRLEALINFQTMVCDITRLDIANASLLDESTAIAEAMSMLFSTREKEKKKSTHIFIDENIYPQNLAVVKTRAEPLGIHVETGKWTHCKGKDMSKYFALVVQFPNVDGKIENDHIKKIKTWQEQDVKIIVAADIMSLTIYTPPGDYNADVAVGSTQRLGIPLGYGGPSAAYFACQEKYKRRMPGRIIGASKDKNGNVAFRMALQTREQHIKREKATSNICTSQALLATMAGLYATYHGPNGMLKIGKLIHQLAEYLRLGITALGYNVIKGNIFDTVNVIDVSEEIAKVKIKATDKKVNLKYSKDSISISLNETTSIEDVQELLQIFNIMGKNMTTLGDLSKDSNLYSKIDSSIKRTSSYLQHPVFNKYHSEHEMLRYLKQLENKDISLAHSMIPLGSCTMKLNATTEMMPLSWSKWSNIHPYAPINQVKGYHQVINSLGQWLTNITGFESISFQPNSGAQGEYAGLWLIDKYHKSRQDHNRDVVFIPQSAHGTNPASAVMCGKNVVIIKCKDKGEIDILDLKAKLSEYLNRLCALMVTYPSTRGVFDSNIKEVCDLVHDGGGQVYMDGANMNAQIGLTTPAIIGADVCHLNLHKTFAIPHGGGGPGMGPICYAKHLSHLLPEKKGIEKKGIDDKKIRWSSSVYGSASILAISYAYIAMMGANGMKVATEVAILNANYVKARLYKHYNVLYTGDNGCVAHELIVDCRPFRDKNILVEDIAKRLIDYGFHAPTVSFPVVGALMVEPTESESKEELDRFCDAMISIREEIENVKAGDDNNILKNAPHTAEELLCVDWKYPYSREEAAYPLPYLKDKKYWPPVSRIDNAYGDRNLFCVCPTID